MWPERSKSCSFALGTLVEQHEVDELEQEVGASSRGGGGALSFPRRAPKAEGICVVVRTGVLVMVEQNGSKWSQKSTDIFSEKPLELFYPEFSIQKRPAVI